MNDMYTQECCNCYMRFSVPAQFDQDRRRDAKTFYCPVGHPQSYKEGEFDRIRRERDRLAQQIAQRDDEIARQKRLREEAERSNIANRGVITRLKNRASAGVCPCCNRTVSQMARHMATKHPGFKAEEVS